MKIFKRLSTGEYGDIAPYDAQEAAMAFEHMRRSPQIFVISKYLFPDKGLNHLKTLVADINTIDKFQEVVMSKAVKGVIDRTTDGLSFDGIENLKAIGGNGCYLAVSNHRDIVLDPAFIQYILLGNNMPNTQIAVGDNLLKNDFVSCLMRCNRMIKVIRGISARELYLSSKVLSAYIRHTITSGEGSVWIAQREGRTKNGLDITEQGLLKMFDMSGDKSFVENFSELKIVPVSISYEYEPCDIRKAREVLISREKKYVKKPKEDMHSILTGIKQKKGHVHIHFDKPLSEETLQIAADCQRNDRYQFLMSEMDKVIISNYKLWNTNYMAYDWMEGTERFTDKYTPEDMKAFKKYIERQLNKVEITLNRDQLRDVLLHIYGNPVKVRCQSL